MVDLKADPMAGQKGSRKADLKAGLMDLSRAGQKAGLMDFLKADLKDSSILKETKWKFQVRELVLIHWEISKGN